MLIFQKQKNIFLGKKEQKISKKTRIFPIIGTLCMIIALCVAAWPWVAGLSWHVQNTTQVLGVVSDNKKSVLSEQTVEYNIEQGNYLIIPKINVSSPIYEGTTNEALLKGIWRLPNTATPALGSNTVLTAHRFQYTFGPQTFYHLDKLAVGDRMYVYWQGKEYMYEVSTAFEVSDKTIEIENSTKQPTLTLYTCELFDPSKRLVVQAALKSTMQIAETNPSTELEKISIGD